MAYVVQAMKGPVVNRTATIHGSLSQVGRQSSTANPPYGIYVQMIGSFGGGGRVSQVKIMRPDHTWASVFQVAGVHIRRTDGTWEILN